MTTQSCNGIAALPASHFSESPDGHKNCMGGMSSSPPGPRGPPLFGQAFNLDTSYMHIQFMEWQKQYGDFFMFKVLGKHYLVISHPEILRKMFVTCEHAQRFNDRPTSFMGNYVIEKTKDVVFRSYDDKQKYMKQTCMCYIEHVATRETWFREKMMSEMEFLLSDVRQYKNMYDNKSVPQILSLLDKCTTKVVSLLLSGRNIPVEDPALQSIMGFMETSNELGTVKNQTVLTALPSIRKMPGHLKSVYDKLQSNKEVLKKVFIEENKTGQGVVCMLQKSAKQLEEEKGETWLNDEFIMGVVMDHTAAAIVPIQNTLSVLLLVLAHHPEVQEKIRQAISGLTSCPTFDDVIKIPYLSAFMLELKRFHTPLPISARHSNRSGDVPFENYTIPKNTEIFSNLFGMHHDTRFWQDPWTFDPDRFLTADGLLVPEDSQNMKNMLAGGVGPRACLGQRFTDSTLSLITATLLQKYQIAEDPSSPLPECDPRQFLPGVVTRVKDFKCIFRDVSEENGDVKS